MTHGERAEANFRKGYNCAQADYRAWAEVERDVEDAVPYRDVLKFLSDGSGNCGL